MKIGYVTLGAAVAVALMAMNAEATPKWTGCDNTTVKHLKWGKGKCGTNLKDALNDALSVKDVKRPPGGGTGGTDDGDDGTSTDDKNHPNNGHGNDPDHNDDSNQGHSNDPNDNTDADGSAGHSGDNHGHNK